MAKHYQKYALFQKLFQIKVVKHSISYAIKISVKIFAAYVSASISRV